MRLPSLILVLSVLAGLSTVPCARAASFILPDDAVLDVRMFTFPQSIQADERDLAAAFRRQLILAFERAGYTVLAEDPPEASPLSPTQSGIPLEQYTEGTPAPSLDEEDAPPLEITPLTEDAAPAAGQADNPESAENDQEAADSVPQPAPEPSAPAGQARIPVPGTVYVLSGQVTLMREDVGNPVRIAGEIRVRTESAIHCAYTLKDARNHVLVTNVASSSAARVTAQTHDIDGVLGVLTTRVLSTAAARIAGALSGSAMPGGSFGRSARTGDDRSQYQDSPGKRLRPE